MRQSHSTRPQPIQLVPTMQKMLFTSSFLAKFMKIRFTNVAGTSSFLYVPADFFFPQCQPVPGAYLGQSGPLWPTSDTQKTWAKNSKQLTVENFGTETETECCSSHPFTTKKPRNQRHILIFFELLLP